VANINNPLGLRPLSRTFAGGAPQSDIYTKAAAYAYAIYKWDPVTLLAGVLNGPANGITAGTTRYLGVVLGNSQASATGAAPTSATLYCTASTLATLLVEVSPDSLFVVSGDGSAAGLTAATIGYNANLNLTGTPGGGVTRDNSGVQLTETSIAVTSTLDVKILALYNQQFIAGAEGGNTYGAYDEVEVKFNKHLMNPEITAT